MGRAGNRLPKSENTWRSRPLRSTFERDDQGPRATAVGGNRPPVDGGHARLPACDGMPSRTAFATLNSTGDNRHDGPAGGGYNHLANDGTDVEPSQGWNQRL